MKIIIYKSMVATLCASAASLALAQTGAEEVESLGQQLGAQKAINQQLRQRLDVLERQLEARTKSSAPMIVGLDASSPAPRQEPQTDTATTAIEETLGVKGVTLLPVGMVRVTPAVLWSHNGAGAGRLDAYAMSIGVETGLPFAMAVAAAQPYVWRDDAMNGSNQGQGDFSLSLAKKLTNETDTMPSLVAKLGYKFDTGKDPFTPRPIGSGFSTVDLSLTALKRHEPVALYGHVSYAHSFEKAVTIFGSGSIPLFNGHIQPGDAYSLGMGISLAATPTISLDAGLTFSFVDKSNFRPNSGGAYSSDRATAGYLNVGTGFLLSKRLFLSVSASAGVTAEASDFIVSVALPYRF